MARKKTSSILIRFHDFSLLFLSGYSMPSNDFRARIYKIKCIVYPNTSFIITNPRQPYVDTYQSVYVLFRYSQYKVYITKSRRNIVSFSKVFHFTCFLKGKLSVNCVPCLQVILKKVNFRTWFFPLGPTLALENLLTQSC